MPSSLLFVLVAAEGTLSVVRPGWRAPIHPPICRRPELYEHWAPHGYRLRPSRTTQYLYPRDNPRRLTLVSNSAGFRDAREFAESDGRTRVLFVGDSWVFGEGVEAEERFTNLLETMKPDWRIDNLGMAGFGPGLMLRALDTVGRRSRPDAVVFCLYADDFRRIRPSYAGVGFEVPRYRVELGRLVDIPYPRPTLLNRLRLIQGVRRAAWRLTDAERVLNDAVLQRFLQIAESDCFQPCLVFLPRDRRTELDDSNRAWLARFAAAHGTPFVDLTDPVLAAGRGVFIVGNWHLNPQGHDLVAALLGPFLERVMSRAASAASQPTRDALADS